jgi:thiol-disulfide isomerase/thioredoxin
MVNLTEIRKKTVSATEYINGLDEPFRQGFIERKQTYPLHTEAVERLKKLGEKYVVVAFSAAWCKDCAVNIPILALLSEETGMEVRVFGGIKKDPLSHLHRWRMPPSPPETESFKIDKLPSILVFNAAGNEIGRIVEGPKLQPSLEQELIEVIKTRQACVE